MSVDQRLKKWLVSGRSKTEEMASMSVDQRLRKWLVCQ